MSKKTKKDIKQTERETEKDMKQPEQQVEKTDVKKVFRALICYMKPYWIYMILATAATTVGVVVSLISPTLIGDIVDLIMDGIMTGMDFDGIWDIGRLLIILYLISFVFDYSSMFTMANVTQFLSKRMRRDLNDKIDTLPLKYFDATSSGDILSRVTNDVDSLATTLNQSFVSLIASIIMLFGSGYMMFRENALMAWSAIGAAVVGFALMGIIGAKSQKYFTSQREELGEITGHVEEVFTGHAVVKSYDGEELVKEQFDNINKRLYKSSFMASFISSIMMPLMMFIGNLGFVFVCVVGAVQVMNGDITFGVIAQFMIYIRLFTSPLGEIANGAIMFQGAIAASGRIFGFFEEEEVADESHKKSSLSTVSGAVEFKNVKFSYKADKPIINNFTANVKPGQKVAIVGPTGAGKTTIVNLLMRFYEVNGGSISVDGVNLQDIPRESVYDLFCMVLQDTWLFEASVRENIVYNKPDVRDEDVKRVCKAVGIHHYIKSLPQGYDTVLTDKVSLSVGQKQLLTIARAMLSDAPMLILDEATSSVDTRTELLIQQAMDKLMVGRTSFVIAHRLSTIKNADTILVMNQGDIIESGSHDELLEQDGFYANLYNSQFEEEDA